MALHLSLLLLLLFLILYRVSAVRRVSVQAGGSITIPCHYDQYYKNHVKYWCKGYDWSRCSSLVRSDHPKSSGNASISDDINQRVFTVTMTDLEPEDSKTYRCVVEINGGPDIGIQRFYLSVTPGTPELYVDQQEVTAVEGGSVTVRCYYSNSGDIKWCRMGEDNKAKDQTTNNSVSADPEQDIIYSTVSHTRETAQQQVPFPEDDDDVTYSTVIPQHKAQLKVEAKAAEPDDNVVYSSLALQVTTQTGRSITIPCQYDLNHINHVKYWCKGFLWHGCSYVVRTDHPKISGKASISDDINKRIFTMTMTNLKSWDSENYRCIVEINGGPDIRIQWFYLSVTLGTPELYVDQQEVTGVEGGSVTVRCYYSNSGDMKWCRMGGDCSADPEQDIIYSTVSHTRETAQQSPNPDSHHDVIYSTVIPDQFRTEQKQAPFPEDDDDDVTYSTVILQHKAQLKVQAKAAEPDDNVVYRSLALQVTTQQRATAEQQ
ncbi:hypothetical protein J4Q44_G00361430 [Coregonus suidteri]|uniref:Ig-like domain-containing protein n=1 Tax=Coregonus suidteri TaxID=861788 RepID=A0AAN8KLV8_9TELE